MNLNFGLRKYVPGQVVGITKNNQENMYLVIAANNRRIVVLKIADGNPYTTNWLFPLDGTDKNVVLDCPIILNLYKTGEIINHIGWFGIDQLTEILLHHYAAMAAQGNPDIFNDPRNISRINEIIRSHSDSLLSYSVNTVTFNDTTVNDVKEKELTAPKVSEEVNIEKIPENIPEVKDIPSPEPGETSVNTISEAVAVDTAPKPGKAEKSGSNRSFTAQDAYILSQRGRTSATDCYAEMKRLGIEDPEHVMAALADDHKVAFLNGRFNVILKKNATRANTENYNDLIVQDCKKFGIPFTAGLWQKSYSCVYTLYKKYKDR